jgi:FMN phosphatase YigB (HAD superfamily)
MEKKLEVVLFDLDGTLLPMDQDVFVQTYFGLLAKNLSNYGYEPKKLIESIWLGTKSMIMNDGKHTNEKVFWNTMSNIYGPNVINDESKFESFYINDFPLVKNSCGFDKRANEVIKFLKSKGYRLILATNPIFPRIATEQRIKWAGLDINDFEFVTTYENSSFSKPNLKYYLEILEKNDCKVENCLMVGNDVAEDMIINKLGVDVFLLTRDLINKNNEDINNYPNGNFDDLLEYVCKKSDF